MPYLKQRPDWFLAGATLALLIAPAGAVGQRVAPIPQSTLNAVRWPAPSAQFTQLRAVPGTLPRTYWLEGGVIGGVGLGVLTGLSVRGLCESSNCTGGMIAAGVLGGAVGFTVGALVGGQFRKGEKGGS